MKLNSYLETIVYEKIYELFDDSLIERIEINQYYDWLIDPYTNKSLQLDFLIHFKEKIDFQQNGEIIRKDAMLAIEVQGQQHYQKVNEFHKKKNDLKRQQKRDLVKLKICRKLGIPLIRLNYKNISWKMDLKRLILNQIDQFKKDNEFGIKNREFLLEHISNLSKFNYQFTFQNKEVTFVRNEWINFLKND